MGPWRLGLEAQRPTTYTLGTEKIPLTPDRIARAEDFRVMPARAIAIVRYDCHGGNWQLDAITFKVVN